MFSTILLSLMELLRKRSIECSVGFGMPPISVRQKRRETRYGVMPRPSPSSTRFSWIGFTTTTRESDGCFCCGSRYQGRFHTGRWSAVVERSHLVYCALRWPSMEGWIKPRDSGTGSRPCAGRVMQPEATMPLRYVIFWRDSPRSSCSCLHRMSSLSTLRLALTAWRFIWDCRRSAWTMLICHECSKAATPPPHAFRRVAFSCAGDSVMLAVDGLAPPH